MNTPSRDPSLISTRRSTLSGRLVLPGDPAYDQGRAHFYPGEEPYPPPAPSSILSPPRSPNRARAGYPGSTGDRLREIKARYDLTNLFQSNPSSKPAAPVAA